MKIKHILAVGALAVAPLGVLGTTAAVAGAVHTPVHVVHVQAQSNGNGTYYHG